MTDIPTPRQAIAVQGRSKRLAVTGKLRIALLEMVWAGSCRADAAKAAGLQDHSLRSALRKPHVKAFYLGELEVLRTSERARNIHALVGVRDKSANGMAVVQAARTLDQLADGDPIGRAVAITPGITIVIASAPAPSVGSGMGTPLLDLNPTPNQDDAA